MEGCRLLADARKPVEKGDMCTWRTRHIHKKPAKEKKGPVEPEKEEEVDELERLFCHIYEFHNPVPAPAVFVPAELPPRYAINLVPALPVIASPAVPVISPVVPAISSVAPAISAVAASSSVYPVVSSANLVFPTVSADSSDSFSVVSSANFFPPSMFTSTPCIDPTQ